MLILRLWDSSPSLPHPLLLFLSSSFSPSLCPSNFIMVCKIVRLQRYDSTPNTQAQFSYILPHHPHCMLTMIVCFYLSSASWFILYFRERQTERTEKPSLTIRGIPIVLFMRFSCCIEPWVQGLVHGKTCMFCLNQSSPWIWFLLPSFSRLCYSGWISFILCACLVSSGSLL